MNKKIKMIELVNRIESGEEIPEKIKYNEMEFKYDKSSGKYTRKNSSIITWFCIERFTNDFLNKTVEILEDNSEEIEELTYFCIGNAKSTDQTKMIDKINELVRIVNSIRKNIDKEYCCCCGVEITDENRAMNDMCNECKYGIDWSEKE